MRRLIVLVVILGLVLAAAPVASAARWLPVPINADLAPYVVSPFVACSPRPPFMAGCGGLGEPVIWPRPAPQ